MAATAGYSVLVKVSTATGGTYYAIGYANDGSFSPNYDELDVSAFSASITSQQLLMGLSKGKSSIKCVYDTADTNGQVQMRTSFLARTALYFQFLANPNAAAGSQGFKIKAYITQIDVNATVNGLPGITFTLAHSGAPVVDNGNADAA